MEQTHQNGLMKLYKLMTVTVYLSLQSGQLPRRSVRNPDCHQSGHPGTLCHLHDRLRRMIHMAVYELEQPSLQLRIGNAVSAIYVD